MVKLIIRWVIIAVSLVVAAWLIPGITIEGTNRALAVTDDAELVTVPAFSGGIEQLWRIDQLIDGTYRIMPKMVYDYPLVLSAVGISTPSLAKFDVNNDNGRWNLKKP